MAPIFILIVSIAIFRTIPWYGDGETVREFAGWAPMMGFALCGGVFLPRKLALWLPAAALLITGGVVNYIVGLPVLNWFSIIVALSAILVSLAGAGIKKKGSLSTLLATSILSTVLFHILSNTVSFFWDPGYAKTLHGWWQCQTVGLPQFPPTWIFTLRQLTGDLLFCTAFFACCRRSLNTRGIVPAPSATVAA